MKSIRYILIIGFVLLFNCHEDQDDNLVSIGVVNDFVWKGMNSYYLYKDAVPDLANDRFVNNGEYANFINAYGSPESLFESLIYNRTTVDKYSWIVDNYIELEQRFSGISTSNGVEYNLYYYPNNPNKVYGIVKYIQPNSNASDKDIKRGDLFYGVNDIELTGSNYSSLLGEDTYTLNMGNYNDGGTASETEDDSIETSAVTIALSKVAYTKNPVFKTDIIPVNNENVGYLVYNSFTSDFDSQLNDAFALFKSNSVKHLVLDLRYNSGGSVNSAILLSSMITGQFTGEVFNTAEWNSGLQSYFETNSPESLINRFVSTDDGTPLNSLNLTKVYVLTTKRSASASELVINCLNPYIEVIQIGDTTSGKYQASITLYDSNNLITKQGINPNHYYAMQPLIYKSLNSQGVTDYSNGLDPDIVLIEDPTNFGVLGDVNEPLLAAAIANIQGSGRPYGTKQTSFDAFFSSGDLIPFSDAMYVEQQLPDASLFKTNNQ